MRYMGSLHYLCFLQKKQLLQLHFRSKLGQASYMFYVSHPILKGCHCCIFKIFLQIVGLKGWRSIALWSLHPTHCVILTSRPYTNACCWISKKNSSNCKSFFHPQKLTWRLPSAHKTARLHQLFSPLPHLLGPSVGHANTSPPMLLKTWLLKSEV